jgi:hypothetical protein
VESELENILLVLSENNNFKYIIIMYSESLTYVSQNTGLSIEPCGTTCSDFSQLLFLEYSLLLLFFGICH